MSGLEDAKGAETVVILADSTASTIEHLGSGFHGGFLDSNEGTLLTDLRPAALRGRFTIASQDSEWIHINAVGGVAVMAFPYSIADTLECPKCEFPCTTCIAYGDVDTSKYCYVTPGLECWEDYVGAVVDTVLAVRQRFPNLEIHYDIWNEPDLRLFWDAPGFANNSLFYAV